MSRLLEHLEGNEDEWFDEEDDEYYSEDDEYYDDPPTPTNSKNTTKSKKPIETHISHATIGKKTLDVDSYLLNTLTKSYPTQSLQKSSTGGKSEFFCAPCNRQIKGTSEEVHNNTKKHKSAVFSYNVQKSVEEGSKERLTREARHSENIIAIFSDTKIAEVLYSHMDNATILRIRGVSRMFRNMIDSFSSQLWINNWAGVDNIHEQDLFTFDRRESSRYPILRLMATLVVTNISLRRLQVRIGQLYHLKLVFEENITDKQKEVLLPHLQSLQLTRLTIFVDKKSLGGFQLLQEFLKQSTGLEELTLVFTGAGGDQANVSNILPTILLCPSLRYVSLTDCDLHSIHSMFQREFSITETNLERIHFKKAHLLSRASDYLAQWLHASSRGTLEFEDCVWDQSKLLYPALSASSLVNLRVIRTKIYTSELESMVEHLPRSLISLYFENIPFSGDALDYLAEYLPKAGGLTTLQLDRCLNRIKDVSELFAQPTQITNLSLKDNTLICEDFASLTSKFSEYQPQLRKLDLTGNSLDLSSNLFRTTFIRFLQSVPVSTLYFIRRQCVRREAESIFEVIREHNMHLRSVDFHQIGAEELRKLFDNYFAAFSATTIRNIKPIRR